MAFTWGERNGPPQTGTWLAADDPVGRDLLGPADLCSELLPPVEPWPAGPGGCACQSPDSAATVGALPACAPLHTSVRTTSMVVGESVTVTVTVTIF